MEYRMQVRRWIVALVALLAWFGGTGLALTPDGLALMELKKGLTSVSPAIKSWNASDPSPCSWGGINCTDNGHVRTIILPTQVPRLEGKLSASLGKLNMLEVLWLDGNLLSGSIPPEIGNLSNLRVFSLSFQNFSGEIPLQLGQCRSLVELWLNQNNFAGDITSVLEELSKLPAIEQIGLDGNGFSGTLPPSIGNATTLTYLSLGVSYYEDPTFQEGKQLIQGQRGGGFGGRIPKELGKLVNLSTLWLGGNSFSGEIPQELGNLILLNLLDLGNNNLSGEIPPELGNMTSLKELKIFNNSITGPIRDSLSSLSLDILSLSYNGLTGSIPTNMFKLTTSLQQVMLQNNSMSGPIPQDLGRFHPNLTFFVISNNFFNGTLPDGLCQGGKLQWLQVDGNILQGAIPPSLADCGSLTQARLSNNLFTSIPPGFGSNSLLSYLDASRNQLIGPLPVDLAANSSLAFLDLSENRLTGDISILKFSQLAQNLSILNLAKNNFNGEIPATMAMCKLLFRVDLSYNSLTGIVPLSLANLSRLQELHLQGNSLTTLHPSIYSGFATTLHTLNLAANLWNAPIPTEIGSLRALRSLNLSYGGHMGPIPSALGQLTQLQVLDLSHNNLTGEVPSALGELMVSLVFVDVSFNHLTGSLPPAWVKLLVSNPASFQGNPGLCLHYNSNNMCVSSHSGAGAGGKLKLSVNVIVGMVLLGVVIALVVALVVFFRRRKPEQEEVIAEKNTTKNLTKEPLPMTFEDILRATENLNDAYVIGKGAHGVVYKVKCASASRSCMAVKKILFVDVESSMLHKSFWSEVETMGQAKHRNLVRLLGFMKRDEVGLLLYDYVSNGDLHSALHNTDNDPYLGRLHLSWKVRLRIAKDVAHGLAYLHHDHNTPIVHRDIKSSNVLLDDDLHAYISDFGLAKVLDTQTGSKQDLSTQNIAGTKGYIAPEVGYGTKVTSMVDVYSYGVLLLELLTGKEPVQYDSFCGEALHLVAWVKEKVKFNQGRMSESILDPLVVDPMNLVTSIEMLHVQEIALKCTQDNPADRPTMRDVENMLSSPLSQTTKMLNEDGALKENLTEFGVENKCNNGLKKGCCKNGHVNRLQSKVNVKSIGHDSWSESNREDSTGASSHQSNAEDSWSGSNG